MKFEITRISDSLSNKKPCEGAYSEPVKGDWLGRKNQWFIDFNSLEELLKFIEKEGHIVVSNYGPAIEIYDDYRE